MVQALTVNYLVAFIFGYFSASDLLTASVVISKPWISLSLLSGILLVATFFVYAVSVEKVGVAITSVSGKMSVVIPVLTGFVFFNETAGWMRISGILLALLAFYLTLKKTSSQKVRLKYAILPFLLFLGNGLNDSVFNISQELYITDDFTDFLTVAFGVSLLICLTILLIQLFGKKNKLNIRSMSAGIALGLLNWFSTYFFLVGLSFFDVSVFVPVFNASIVIVAALIGYFFFKEKFSAVNFIGILLSVVAILLIAGIKF
ncbi:MAG: DMT family transporter [Bacteroidales bacterium]|jgi:drug/metabolite transporter (DMT)-like permease|nr:DMT family transporter [Bacteroidales bacterium]MDD4214838.1 DMT family transporter [Bacteroidales bacterium]